MTFLPSANIQHGEVFKELTPDGSCSYHEDFAVADLFQELIVEEWLLSVSLEWWKGLAYELCWKLFSFWDYDVIDELGISEYS